MAERKSKVEIGSRWEDRDWREAGRVIEVIDSSTASGAPKIRCRTVQASARLGSAAVGSHTGITMTVRNLRRRFRELPPHPAAGRDDG